MESWKDLAEGMALAPLIMEGFFFTNYPDMAFQKGRLEIPADEHDTLLDIMEEDDPFDLVVVETYRPMFSAVLPYSEN